jgi:hypothetical protein
LPTKSRDRLPRGDALGDLLATARLLRIRFHNQEFCDQPGPSMREVPGPGRLTCSFGQIAW